MRSQLRHISLKNAFVFILLFIPAERLGYFFNLREFIYFLPEASTSLVVKNFKEFVSKIILNWKHSAVYICFVMATNTCSRSPLAGLPHSADMSLRRSVRRNCSRSKEEPGKTGEGEAVSRRFSNTQC